MSNTSRGKPSAGSSALRRFRILIIWRPYSCESMRNKKSQEEADGPQNVNSNLHPKPESSWVRKPCPDGESSFLTKHELGRSAATNKNICQNRAAKPKRHSRYDKQKFRYVGREDQGQTCYKRRVKNEDDRTTNNTPAMLRREINSASITEPHDTPQKTVGCFKTSPQQVPRGPLLQA
ncbi:hypothetical protein F2Q68_00016430 [Brassica cretica]|uniref:Uncharacterized protein n=1 Tax=Brassica cretica TaxID=69181 RepID=A0A8S9HG86_BRACR|nr:hypothetical protein F2Q68_00016430 [Brassica cretica]